MSTQWTMTWLVRWRVRGRASCFFARDDHEMASSPHVAVRNMAFENSFHGVSHNNLSRTGKKCSKSRQLKSPMVKDKEFDDSSWSLSGDEDYIVFCFREDGAFDVVKDGKGVKSEAVIRGVDEKHKRARPVNRKLNYGGDEEQEVSDSKIHEKRSNDTNQHGIDEQYQDCITFSKEEEAKEKGRKQHRESITRACHIEGIEECVMVSSESSDSDESEGSTSSFAFPVLGWERMGSPAKMPKSEGLCQKKQKVRFVPFQCCRF